MNTNVMRGIYSPHGIGVHSCYSRVIIRCIGVKRLLYLQHKSLKVFAFRVIDVDGMVSGLMNLVEDAHVSTTLCCSCEYRQTELVFVYRL